MSSFCSSNLTANNRKSRYQSKRLEIMKLMRDALERRLSGLDASIATLEKQIERDNNQSESNI